MQEYDLHVFQPLVQVTSKSPGCPPTKPTPLALLGWINNGVEVTWQLVIRTAMPEAWDVVAAASGRPFDVGTWPERTTSRSHDVIERP